MFNKAIWLYSGDISARHGLGYLFSEEKRYADAEKMFKEAIQLNSKDDSAYLGLRCVYRDENRHSDAEAVSKIYLKVIQKTEKEIESSMLSNAVSLRIQHLKDKGIIGLEYYGAKTQHNYRELKRIVLGRNKKFVCVQEPTLKVGPLIEMLGTNRIIFVDNEKSFKDGVAREGYDAYFIDRCWFDMGHTTDKGNRLLAENIADVIQKECFNSEAYINIKLEKTNVHPAAH
jgi:tetratricopeptide (TPR) repeat protein